jgi:hypothetical protein
MLFYLKCFLKYTRNDFLEWSTFKSIEDDLSTNIVNMIGFNMINLKVQNRSKVMKDVTMCSPQLTLLFKGVIN